MNNSKQRLFSSWSGGKESAAALYRMIRNGYEVKYLLNMTSTTGRMSRSHGLRTCLLQRQAAALNIPLVQEKASWATYEQKFKRAVQRLLDQGVEGGIFGDIDAIAHRQWVERVSQELGIKAFMPLWNTGREELLREYIDAGFQTIIIAINRKKLDCKWLGRVLDNNSLCELKNLATVDLCGEEGEYHTFVYDCPLFKQPVWFQRGKVYRKGDVEFLELT